MTAYFCGFPLNHWLMKQFFANTHLCLNDIGPDPVCGSYNMTFSMVQIEAVVNFEWAKIDYYRYPLLSIPVLLRFDIY